MTIPATKSVNELFKQSATNSPTPDWYRAAAWNGVEKMVAYMPAARSGNGEALIVHVDIKPWPTGAARKHDAFDALVADLESDPEQAEGVRESRKWVADSFYKERQTLAALRLRAGLSQKELADACGIAQPHVSRYESGKHAPSMEVAEDMATAMGVDLNTFHAAWKNTRPDAQSTEPCQ